MAIISAATYKSICGITGSTLDTRIGVLIPYVQSEIVEECNYDFGENTDDESWPAALVLVAADMITYHLNTQGNNPMVTSESVEGHSVHYAGGSDIGKSGYPIAIEKRLAKFRRISVKMPQVLTQYRDRRGMTPRQIAEIQPAMDVPGMPYYTEEEEE